MSPSKSASTTSSLLPGTATEIPEVALDLLVLAKEHFQYDAVDLVILPKIGDHSNIRLGLAEAVYTAFTLFMTGGVP